MGSWLVHYLAGGLVAPARALPMSVFRLAIALGSLWKFAFELHRGAWTWFSQTSFVGHRYRSRPHRVTVNERWYRVLLVAKLLAAVLLLIGLLPREAAVLLAGWYFFELAYDSKYHTTLYAMSALALAISDGTGQCLTYRTVQHVHQVGFAAALAAERARHCDAFAQVLVVLLISGLYFGSAYRKLVTPAFMSGAVLHRWFENMPLITAQLRHRESWVPASLAGRLGAAPDRFWRPAAIATIGTEAALPVGLLISPCWPVAALAGLGMHAIFVLFYPMRIMPFSIATVTAYLLFLAPS